MIGWHFVAKNKRLGYGDGNTVAPGYVYEVEPPIRLCRWGLHAGERATEALKYAPGPIVCRVELSGQVIRSFDKAVATRREVLWMADATTTLHEFACRVAEQELKDASVTDARSWAVIDAKRKWLAGEITDLDLEAAWEAAWDAARGAARDAASGAAWAAVIGAVVAATRAANTGAHNALLTEMLEALEP